MTQPRRRRGVAAVARALIPIPAAVAVGLFAYWINEAGNSDQITAGNRAATDRVSVFATIEKVDPAQYTANVRISAVPHGRFTYDGGETANSDIRVVVDGLNGDGLLLAKGRRIAAQSMPVELRGEITNYPFDRYSADLDISAMSAGRSIPVDVVVENNDAFFHLSGSTESDDVEPVVHLQWSRSVSTYIMVGLMFTVMWALALSVAAAARVIGRKQLGMVWPAMAWMAATLFAVAAFRGTAPGNPPIGTILDYTAFLWAEAIIVFALTYVVVRGVRLESQNTTATP